jgi:ribosomal protein S6
VKRYEGLFILDLTNKEEGLNDAVDKVKATITNAGGKVDVVQKMEKKAFARVPDKRVSAGHYVNIIFDAEPAAISILRSKFNLVEEVYRVLFTDAPTIPAPIPT